MFIEEQRVQLNRLVNELVSVKTKQEQYQTFINNSQNRKQDIELKITSILAELEKAEPELQELKAKANSNQDELLLLQQQYQDISEILTERSAIYNNANIKFHQQQSKVSTLLKDLEYREHQKTPYKSVSIKIPKNRNR